MSDLRAQTIRDFGEQWQAYRTNEGFYGSVELLADCFGPLLDMSEVRGARVADIGSGTGRIVNMLLTAGAKHVVAVEPSDAFAVLQENTKESSERITYLHAPGEALPPSGDLDLVVSIGVLHHIPEPDPVVRAAWQALRPGGKLFAWLYGREGNQKYLFFAEPLRKVTRRLPHRLLAACAWVLAPCVRLYVAACRFAPLPLRHYMRNIAARLSMKQIQLVIYDQLNPAWAKYYTREEALALFSSAGFEDVRCHHRHGYSWSVVGSKPK